MQSKEIIDQFAQELEQLDAQTTLTNIGRVRQVKDGVIELDGLSEVQMMEEIVCREKNVRALVLNLATETVGAVVLGEFTQVAEGDQFSATGDVMSVPAGDHLTGRVLDAICQPKDGRPLDAKNTQAMPVEKIAPGVFERQPVNEPLQTGVLAIDAMVPVGRGQRELIIGDRNTGKTAIAIDTIINQKNQPDPVICIYVSIGQKESSVAQLVEQLNQHEAMEYTIVVDASASDSVVMQYLAPYSATAIAEYFMQQGKDVLIVYDDLTKHAWAYRQISLTLRRPPGREAYPGDIFYLHSRLLERSCRLKDDLGGGSITSLPIVQTQFGDVSAYIPTNIISITDGQIYLDANFFNLGIRPAIDAGNSVSRVGGAAQTKEMKKVAGQLRLELAQFKELEAFAQFGSADLDQRTQERINRGHRIREIVKQPQFQPLPLSVQIALIYMVNEGFLNEVPLEQIQNLKEKFILYMHTGGEQETKTAVEDFFQTYQPDNE